MSAILQQVFILYIFIFLGWLLGKKEKKLLSHTSILSFLMVNVFLPCKIFGSLGEYFSLDYLLSKGKIIILSCSLLAVLHILSIVLSKFIAKSPYEKKVYAEGYSMGEKSLEGTNDGFKGFLDDISDPVITPVMDLSNVNRGFAELNNGFSRNRAIGIDSRFEAADVRTNNMLNAMMNSMNKMGNQNQPNTNYFTFNVDGAENPEDFAKRFVRQVQLEMRTG